MTLSVENLSFSYGPRKALNDLSFTLAPGSFTALLGMNGANYFPPYSRPARPHRTTVSGYPHPTTKGVPRPRTATSPGNRTHSHPPTPRLGRCGS
jgi:hypothetical protein